MDLKGYGIQNYLYLIYKHVTVHNYCINLFKYIERNKKEQREKIKQSYMCILTTCVHNKPTEEHTRICVMREKKRLYRSILLWNHLISLSINSYKFYIYEI